MELAQASGVGRWLIQLVESGIRAPSDSEWQALGNALGVSVHKLRKQPFENDSGELE